MKENSNEKEANSKILEQHIINLLIELQDWNKKIGYISTLDFKIDIQTLANSFGKYIHDIALMFDLLMKKLKECDAIKVLDKNTEMLSNFSDTNTRLYEIEKSLKNLQKKINQKVTILVKDITNSSEDDLREKLSLPIEHIELSIRTYNALYSHKIKTLEDLVIKTESDLMGLRNFGRKSLKEIEGKLKEMGLSLGMEL